MTIKTQSKGLFKPEVYEAMQEELKCPSRYRSVEEALDSISADRRMQSFFRDYAKKEGIYSDSTFSFRTRTGKDMALFIAGESAKIEWLGAQKRREGLYLGPRQNENPLLFVYAHNSQIVPGKNLGFSYGSFSKRNKEWVINIPKYDNSINGDYHHTTFLVSRASLFDLSKSDILAGLEKMIKNILRGKVPQ